MAVYDDQQERETQRGHGKADDFEGIIGHSIDPDEEKEMERTAHSGAAEDIARREGFFRNEDGDPSGKDKLSPDELKEAESGKESAGRAAAAAGGTGTGSMLKYLGGAASELTPAGRILALAKRRKKEAGIGAAIVAGITAILISFFISVLPLKVNHIVENLQAKAFGPSTQAVGDETDNLLSSYMARHVIPGIKHGLCTDTLTTKECVAPISGSSPISQLYRGWRDAKLEHTLATQYGIEFAKDSSNRVYMKAPGLPSGGINVSDLGSAAHPTLFDYASVSRSEARLAIKNASQEMTLWDRVMFRYKVGRLAQEKYGIRRCIIYCDLRDNFSDKLANKQAAFKLRLIERVIEPRAPNLASALKCFIEPSCDPTNRTTDSSNVSDATNGEADSNYEREVRNNLSLSAASFGKKLDDLAPILEKIRTEYGGSFSSYLIGEVLAKLGVNEATNKAITSAIPIFGWINFAAQAIQEVHNAGPKLKALTYAINAATYVQTYMMYRTTADEVKVINGHNHMDPTELGSFVNSLGPGAQQGGLGAGAEATPLYANLIGEGTNTQTALLDAVFPKAYALSSSSGTQQTNTYTCDDGKPVPLGHLICLEEDLRSGNALGAAVSAVSAAIPNPFPTIASLWNSTFGQIFNFFGSAGASIFSFVTCGTVLKLACDQFMAIISQIALPFFSWIVMNFLQTVVTTNMSGGRAFTAAAGGALVLGQQNCQHQLGCQKVTPQQYGAIVNQQEQDQLDSFRHQPFMARMFDGSSQYSFVSRLSMAIPSSSDGLFSSSLLNLLSNPFSKLSSAFGAVFAGPHALAAGNGCDASSAFGVSCYGYPPGTIPKDPEAYWNDPNNHCEDGQQTLAWNQSAITNVNPDTGQAENSTVDPCLLIRAAVTSGGAMFTDSVLTNDDKYGNAGGEAVSSPPVGTCSVTAPVYGSGNGTGGPEYTQQQLTQLFGDPGTATSHPVMDANLTTVDFNGHSVQVNKLAAGCLSAVAQDIAARNINYTIRAMGCYRFDTNNGSSNIGLSSYHTYGVACDINPDTNPFVSGGATAPYDMPDAYVQAFHDHGWTWGGSWTSVKDYMHFEFNGLKP